MWSPFPLVCTAECSDPIVHSAQISIQQQSCECLLISGGKYRAADRVRADVDLSVANCHFTSKRTTHPLLDEQLKAKQRLHV
jgi:hypothetical protein